jgi:hypothetical protein
MIGEREMPPGSSLALGAGRFPRSWLSGFLQPGSPWDRAARYSAYMLIALAVLSGFAYVYSYGVNVYWGDDWDTLPQLFERHAAVLLQRVCRADGTPAHWLLDGTIGQFRLYWRPGDHDPGLLRFFAGP